MTILDLAPPVTPRTDLRLLRAALLAVVLVIFTHWAFAADLAAPPARLALDSHAVTGATGDTHVNGEPANNTAAAPRARQVAGFGKVLAEL
ncbi:MAG: hypothetical protein ABI790_14770 [Betaproteobacteria bacterium]